MTALTQLVTDLLALAQLFISAGTTFLIPAYNTTTSSYDVTLMHVAVWAPILMALIGGGGRLIFSFIRRGKSKAAAS